MPRHTHPILGLDPGLKDLGWTVIDGRRLVGHGVIALRLTPRAERRAEARRRLRALIVAHRPRAIAIEKTYPHPVPWLHELHLLTLDVRRMARAQRIPVATYASQAVRATVASNGKAKKPAVAIAIAQRFRSLRVYLTQDRVWKERFWLNMFDAAALALHHQLLTQPPSRSR